VNFGLWSVGYELFNQANPASIRGIARSFYRVALCHARGMQRWAKVSSAHDDGAIGLQGIARAVQVSRWMDRRATSG
jgi:hypothetical protein